MKIIFIGTVKSSYKKLALLCKLNANIVGVITKKESLFNADFQDLTPLCKKNNIPFIFSNTSVNDSYILNWVKEKSPDIIFCFGWSEIIKKDLLDIPKIGIIGYHPAALPQNRGRHPLIWALVLGLKETASTFFFMDQGADSGDILSQEKIHIIYSDNADSLYEKVTQTALNQITYFLPKLKNKTFDRIPQNHSKSNYWRKRGMRDGQIDFRMHSDIIYNLVRGLTTPYVGAHIVLLNKEIKIWKVKEVKNNKKNIEPGKVLDVNSKNNTFIVKSGTHSIEILKHEFETLPKIGDYL
ncbi:formyl transferase [Candidatus Marinamargulisbacteria bacterium SCGC AG-410-N11]|nr:formyl transferase [Candidatus Marinamargulisbacteria bacterium SCGC AG-410-N11]